MPEFFKSAFAAIPAAAQNSLSFMAYFLVIVSTTLIAWKTRRNKQLLANLEKLPEKDRLKALELEMDTVRVPPNLTPEQWLQSRIHRYYFTGFAIVCLCVVMVFALAVSLREKKDSGNVDFVVTPYVPPHTESPSEQNQAAETTPRTEPEALKEQEKSGRRKTKRGGKRRVQGRKPRSAERSRPPAPPPAPVPAGPQPGRPTASSTPSSTDLRLTYSYAREGNKLVGEPRMPYLERLKKGGPVSGIAYEWSPFQWTFPQISIKVANSTERLVVPAEAVIQVLKSTPIKEPILVFKEFAAESVMIRNEGWGDVVDARLMLALDREDACLASGSELPRMEDDPIPLGLGTFADYKRVPVLEHLPSGLRSAERVCAFGEVSYGEPDRRRTVKFKVRVSLDRRVTASMPPSNFYDVCLEAGKQGYTKTIGLEQQVAAGAADHFVLTFGSNQSARYELSVSFRGGGDKVLFSQDMNLEVLVPRSSSKDCQEGLRSAPH